MRGYPVALGLLVAIAAAATVASTVYGDPGPDICGTWFYGIVVVAWLAGVPALVLGLASLRWRALRAFSVAILVGAVVGTAAGVVLAQLELLDLRADPRGFYCD